MERAQLLQRARLKKRLTREQVAERLEVDPTTVARWEKGATTPMPMNLLSLCELYGVTAQALGFDGFDELPLAQEQPVVAQNTTEADDATNDAYTAFRASHLMLRLWHIVCNWSANIARYHELQDFLIRELEDNKSMNPNELMKRRVALRLLASLPIELCGLSALVAVLKRPTQEILTHCAAGIVACWYLRKGKDLVFASDAVSRYIPTLKAIATSGPAAQRKAAADLLVQCLLLKSTLAWYVATANDALHYAQQAELYSAIAESHLLQITALRTQAAAYYAADCWDQALQAAEKAAYLLEQQHASTPSQPTQAPTPQFMRSYVYAGLATYQAYHGNKDALSSLKKAHQAFFAQSSDETVPVWIDHSIGNLIVYDGETHTHLGLYKEAVDSFTQISERYAQDAAIPLTNRIGAMNHWLVAELSRDDQPRDLERCLDLWTRALEGAKTLQSNIHFNRATQAFIAMRAAWPGESRIKQLREQLVHW
jgi:transcriptional regulator with XRE-family HTH domain